ncbi:uncharacterized protein LOC143453208 [Clavelina lepadiformis]|uniref:uncharacterized protein LOC143453208 n=1 Tax=Clavelina lepadiformis TaxID=159417 RepID=UPI00404254D0
MGVLPETNEQEKQYGRCNSSTIYVGGKPNSISFSGCGFLGVYHIGVASCLKMHAPTLVKNLDRVYGCSAGSIMGAMLLSGVCFGEVCQRTMAIVMDARSRYLGPLSPGFKLNETLLRDMRSGLPADVHIRATGKLFISLTRLHDGKNVIVSDYKSREELIEVLICSCFVPFYSGVLPPKYRGVRYVDGGLSNNLPADHDTITVSPWSGGSDICPKNDGSNPLDLSFVNQSIQVTASNVYRISTMFFPPNPTVLKEFCAQGFRETVQYLRNNGLFETVHPLKKNLSFSTELHAVEERRRLTRRMSYSARLCDVTEAQENCVFDMDDSDADSDSSQSSDSDVTTAVTLQTPLQERFDENDNEYGSLGSQCIDGKSQNVFTVVHVYPIDHDHVIRVQFQLPAPILQALETAYEQSTSKWKRPLYGVISACRRSFVVRIPLEKTYSTACFLLRHSQSFPSDVKWLVEHLRHLVNKLHNYLKGSGETVVRKLKSVKLRSERKLGLVAHQMTLVVQLLTNTLISRKIPYYSTWLTPVLRQLPCQRSCRVKSDELAMQMV